MVEVGIREFRSHMGRYLERVKDGETIVLTDRGQPVVRMMPEPKEHARNDPVEEKLWAMVRAGKASWNGKRVTPPDVRVRARGPKLVSEMLLEDRD